MLEASGSLATSGTAAALIGATRIAEHWALAHNWQADPGLALEPGARWLRPGVLPQACAAWSAETINSAAIHTSASQAET